VIFLVPVKAVLSDFWKGREPEFFGSVIGLVVEAAQEDK